MKLGLTKLVLAIVMFPIVFYAAETYWAIGKWLTCKLYPQYCTDADFPPPWGPYKGLRTGVADGVFGLDRNGALVLASAMRLQAGVDESVEFGAVPGNGIGVPYVRATSPGVTAFDVFPNGNPSSIAGYGYSWVDVCDKDLSAGPVDVRCAHIAVRDDFVEFSMRSFTRTGDNTGTKLPVVLGVGGDDDLTQAIRLNPDGTLQFTIPNIKANGNVETTLGSLGPRGSHSTVQKWFQIKDQSGTPYFIPAW